METVFALRFGDSEKASNFKKEFEASQVVMEKELAGEDGAADAGADEAAAALEGLSASEKTE